ncbi:hypothetical protein JCM18237_28790 [Halorubrum luteum]
MHPTTRGRFRIHDRRQRPNVDGRVGGDDGRVGGDDGRVGGDDGRVGGDDGRVGGDDGHPDELEPTTETSEEFVIVELPSEPVDPTTPEAADVYDPIYVDVDEGESRTAELSPGYVVDATLAWDDGTARFSALTVVRESRFRFADGVEGMFEAAVDAWEGIHAAGEAMGSVTTRSNDGDPNGALYLFADGPGSDTFEAIRAGRIPIEPLVGRVNAERGDARREVFVLRPAAHAFVAVYVVFDPDGVLARTVRDTYDLGGGLASELGAGGAAGVDGTETDGASEFNIGIDDDPK